MPSFRTLLRTGSNWRWEVMLARFSTRYFGTDSQPATLERGVVGRATGTRWAGRRVSRIARWLGGTWRRREVGDWWRRRILEDCVNGCWAETWVAESWARARDWIDSQLRVVL
jgi:hypothetical protein